MLREKKRMLGNLMLLFITQYLCFFFIWPSASASVETPAVAAELNSKELTAGILDGMHYLTKKGQ